MEVLLERIASALEQGHVDAGSPHPPELAGHEGVDELTRTALDAGIQPGRILSEALIVGMDRVGRKFRNHEIYLPDVLMAARAMTAGMDHLRPYFASGEVEHKGLVLMGTVAGDLHDIGKKIVSMFFEGGGWSVVDLGVDVGAEKVLAAIDRREPVAVGLSALLTTTMANMEAITGEIKTSFPGIQVIIGGAPVNREFAEKIGADAYSPDPQGALEFLNSSGSK